MADRIMYDGISGDASSIHRAFPDAAMVAGYIDKSYEWTPEDWALFPKAVRIQITVSGTYYFGDVLDVENGASSPSDCEAWIARRKAAGYYRPTIYCQLSSVKDVRTGTGKYVLGKDYDLWVASWDGNQSQVYPGQALKQYKNGSGYDISVVYDPEWPHRTIPSPAPKPPATGTQRGWRYCAKCQGLFWGAGAIRSHCPAGGEHDGAGSYDYGLPFTNP